MIDSSQLPFPKGSTKLSRAVAKRAARHEDTRRLQVWARAVKDRDHWTDRKTGQRVYSSRTLDPCRAEAHHVEPKGNKATRTDVRNGLTLSLETHLAVELGRYRIDGTVWFTVKGCRYINANYPVLFVRL